MDPQALRGLWTAADHAGASVEVWALLVGAALGKAKAFQLVRLDRHGHRMNRYGEASSRDQLLETIAAWALALFIITAPAGANVFAGSRLNPLQGHTFPEQAELFDVFEAVAGLGGTIHAIAILAWLCVAAIWLFGNFLRPRDRVPFERLALPWTIVSAFFYPAAALAAAGGCPHERT